MRGRRVETLACQGCGAPLTGAKVKWCSHRCANRCNSQLHRDRAGDRKATCIRCQVIWTYPSLGGRARRMCPPCESDWKFCYRCRAIKARDAFSTDPGIRDGLGALCRSCTSEKRKASPTRKTRARAAHLRGYGLTSDEYDALYASQCGVCAICGGEGGKRGLFIDHCHSSAAVRGLLCHACNAGLGLFRDSQVTLGHAINYLANRESPTT
jgi:hypothetical protein